MQPQYLWSLPSVVEINLDVSLLEAGRVTQFFGLEAVLGGADVAAAEREGLALVLVRVVGPLKQEGLAHATLAGGLGADGGVN